MICRRYYSTLLCYIQCYRMIALKLLVLCCDVCIVMLVFILAVADLGGGANEPLFEADNSDFAVKVF